MSKPIDMTLQSIASAAVALEEHVLSGDLDTAEPELAELDERIHAVLDWVIEWKEEE